MMKRACIYALTEPDGGTIRYIGQTTMNPNERYAHHVAPSSIRCKDHRSNWLRFLRRHGKRPGFEILAEVEEENANIVEIAYIAACRMLGFKLTNQTEGGTANYRYTEEVRQRMSEAHKGKRRPPFTLEHRRNMSRAQKGITRPDEQGENHPGSKLMESEVIEILDLYATGEWTQRALAKKFGVNYITIWDILHQRTWKYIVRPKLISGLHRKSLQSKKDKNYHLNVAKILALYATGKWSRSELAAKFNISSSSVHRITNRLAWKT